MPWVGYSHLGWVLILPGWVLIPRYMDLDTPGILWDTVDKRVVHMLLECFLVLYLFTVNY